MRFLVNPGRSSAARPRRTVARKPSRKQLAARKKFIALAKARGKASGTSRATLESKIMARHKRKAASRRTSGRRRVKRARRSTRTLLANPRRRARRRSPVRRAHARRRFRRNPGLGGGLMTAGKRLAFGLGAALGGVAIGNFVTVNITPKIFAPSATDTAQSMAGKNLLVAGALALGVALYGRKFIGQDVAAMVAIGMLIIPTRNMVYAMAPATAPFTFLGGGTMAMPPFPGGRRAMGAYPARRAIGAYPSGGGAPLGAYPQQMNAYPSFDHQPG